MHTKSQSEKPNRKYHSGYLGIDGSIILNSILKGTGCEWTGFDWIR